MLTACSVVGLLFMIGGVLGLLEAGLLFSASPVAIAVQAAAAALMVWARLTFGRRSFHPTAEPTHGGLVTSGPYHWIRHPIYTALSLFAVAGAFAHRSMLGVALSSLVFAGAVVRMLAEERALLRRFPEYGAYRARTSRMIPRVF